VIGQAIGGLDLISNNSGNENLKPNKKLKIAFTTVSFELAL
jgi:hypothetical protein